MPNRPLSPHLTIYRFAYTMALSIAHRLTGVALSTAFILLVIWLAALAGGAASHQRFAGFASTWLFKLAAGAFLLAYVYHFCNGIRHLFWDAGIGLERAQARRSAAIVVAVTALVTLALLFVIFGKDAA